jgi:hypothetical protein
VLKGADAIVFVADSQSEELAANRESLKNLETNLNEYGKKLGDIPWVIQYNKRDLPSALPVQKLEEELNPTRVPCFEAVATAGTGVYETLGAATKQVLAALRKQLLQDQDQDDDVGGQADSVGAVPQRDPTFGTVGKGKEVSSAITDTTPNIPSPGEEASVALVTADVSCPLAYNRPAAARQGAPDTGPGGGMGGGSLGRGAGLDGASSQVRLDLGRAGETAGGRVTIPIRVLGKGKPGHVLVNLALDLEIVVDDEGKTV